MWYCESASAELIEGSLCQGHSRLAVTAAILAQSLQRLLRLYCFVTVAGEKGVTEEDSDDGSDPSQHQVNKRRDLSKSQYPVGSVSCV